MSSIDSVGSEMDNTNEDTSHILLGKDKTKWFDYYDTSNFRSFVQFEPKIKDNSCDHCDTSLGNCPNH